MDSAIFIGVDCSTTSTKTIAFNSRGGIVTKAAISHATYSKAPGLVEQDAEDWWSALCSSCRRIMGSGLLDRRKIKGISITHQRFSFVPVDSEMHPIRMAILWNDLRCAEEAQKARTEIGTGEIFKATGYPPGQWTLYKIMWLKKHEPRTYERAYKILLVPDFLVFRLTGRLVTSESSAAMTGALDIENKARWASSVVERLGIRPGLWAEPILPGAGYAGAVSRSAALLTGLPERLPVFVSAGDQPCGSLGAGVRNAGQLGINGGTSCSNEFFVNSLPDRREPTYFVEISPTGHYIIENDIPSGGSAVMSWYRGQFGAPDEALATKNREDIWDRIYGKMAETPVGNRGFMIVPYLQGAYGPYWDQDARAACLGLGTDMGSANLVRGLLEGVAYESRREVELMSEASGTQVDEILMYGGSARSDLWNQMFADVYNRPLSVPKSTETTALGAALCAAVGSGVFDSFDAAISTMVSIEKRYSPDEKSAYRYDQYYRRAYCRLYDSIRRLNGEIAQINRELEA